MQVFNRYVSTRGLTVFAAELLLISGSVALAASFQNTPDLASSIWKIGLGGVILGGLMVWWLSRRSGDRTAA